MRRIFSTTATRRALPVVLTPLALALSACAPAPAPAPVYTLTPSEDAAAQAARRSGPAPEVYQVQQGDTLISIAMHYDLDYRELARWNNLRNPNVIQPGQALRLQPPANDPVSSPVQVQRTAVVQRAEEGSVAAASDASTPTPVRRQTTVIGSNAPASPAAAPGFAPYKQQPQATQYAYSPALLKKLRQEWRAQQVAAAAKPAPAPAASPTPAPARTATAAPAQPAKAAAGNAPGKTRQKYGVTWGLPVRGAVLKPFSAQSKGIAFGGARGNPVYAVADGEVIYVGTGVKSYGRLVIVRHQNDYLSAYAHNDEILVKEGQRVVRGSAIAKMGDSGSERVMLHFEVRKGGKPLNPAQVLPQ